MDDILVNTNSLHTKTIDQIPNSKPRIFSDRSISVNQAMKILKKNGIEASVVQAKEILDFLNVFTKIYSNQDV